MRVHSLLALVPIVVACGGEVSDDALGGNGSGISAGPSDGTSGGAPSAPGGNVGSPTTCPAAPAAPWQSPPPPEGNLESLRVHIDDVRKGMVGHWRGIATTPWGPPYDVQFEFDAGGHYSSRCLPASDRCVALNFGTDLDTPLKQIRLTDSTVHGLVSGEIDVAFAYGDKFDLPGWQGVLKYLEIDKSGLRLRFEFSTSQGIEAVKLDLWRCVL
jgi:hypothetical protein